jgi:predicted RNase H-like nuclease (RuvC/YqgF family)
MSLEIMRKVDSILDQADVPERHTYFQMKHFIVGKEPTLAGQLWQVVRELRARRESLEALQEQIDELDDNIKLAHVKIERMRKFVPPSELDEIEHNAMKSKAERELRSLYRTKTNLERKLVYLLQEITYLLGAFDTLSKVEALKPLDDIEAQQQFWNEKFTEELNLRLILRQPLDSDFVKTIMSLDEKSPVKQQLTAILLKVQDNMIAERERQKLAQDQIKTINNEC